MTCHITRAAVLSEQETKLEPNSFVFVSCPDASRSQWHPFTFSYIRNSTSRTEPAHATIYLKPYGRWVQVCVSPLTSGKQVLGSTAGMKLPGHVPAGFNESSVLPVHLFQSKLLFCYHLNSFCRLPYT